MVGRAMIPNRIDPASQEYPISRWPGNVSLRRGTRTVSPKNPYMTEGIPANTSDMLFKTDLNLDGATSDMNIAAATPMGTANSIAPAVTSRVAVIIGTVP